MIVREYLMTRKDGVKLYKTYSDQNKYIRKVGTEEEYDVAIDIDNAPYTYEETENEIESVEVEQ